MITNVEVMTIFNGRTDSVERRKKYIPTVIRKVSHVEAKGATVTNNGVWSDDVQHKIRILLISDVQDERTYESDLKYAALDDEEAAKHWTISKADMVILDEYTGDNLLLYENDIVQYAKENGLDLIRIKEFADDTAGGSLYMKHWRIGGA